MSNATSLTPFPGMISYSPRNVTSDLAFEANPIGYVVGQLTRKALCSTMAFAKSIFQLLHLSKTAPKIPHSRTKLISMIEPKQIEALVPSKYRVFFLENEKKVFVDDLLERWKENSQNETFYLFLGSTLKSSKQLQQIPYFSNEQLVPYEIKLSTNQTLIDFKQRPFASLENKETIFIITQEGKLFGTNDPTHLKSSLIVHSSFSRGAPVLFAGSLKTDSNGHIIEITNRSGHYRPDLDATLTALLTLQQKGLNLSTISLSFYQISHSNEQKKTLIRTYSNAQKFLDSKGLCNPDRSEFKQKKA